MYTPEERRADSALHIVGITAGGVAAVAMIVAGSQHLPTALAVSLAIYGLSMVAMFGCSAAYNMVPSMKWRGLLQRLDHAAIFLKIAGTYTPFAVVMGGVAGYLLLAVVWTTAIFGIGLKLITTNWKGVDIPIYLLLGWVGVLAYRPLFEAVSPIALILLAAGGILYSAGVIFHVWRGLKYHNAIWHGFVLAATACHFGAVNTAVFA
jgi:hemolysin III